MSQLQTMQEVLGKVYEIVSRGKSITALAKCQSILNASGDADLIAVSETLNQFLGALNKGDKAQAAASLESGCKTGERCYKNCDKCVSCLPAFYAALYIMYIGSDPADYPRWVKSADHSIKLTEMQSMRAELQETLGRKRQSKYFYDLLHERLIKQPHPDNVFINLKGMSSSSPILYNSTFHTDYSGGGFFVRWNGHGIVVDPGYNFVKNMGEYFLTIHDVDAVIITHDHIDHNSDVRLLIDMEFQMKNEGQPMIQWYVDAGTAEALRIWLGEENAEKDMHIVSAASCAVNQTEKIPIAEGISLFPFRTEHILYDQNVKAVVPGNYDTKTFGFLIELSDADKNGKPYILGYSSDTAFFQELTKNFENIDMLILNISSVYPEELVEDAQNVRHLGLTGVRAIINGLSMPPRILAVSEFWNGIADIRYDITKFIGKMYGMQTSRPDWTILPLEPGTSIELPSSRVQCSFCGNYAERIHMLRPRQDFGEILLACDRCVY